MEKFRNIYSIRNLSFLEFIIYFTFIIRPQDIHSIPSLFSIKNIYKKKMLDLEDMMNEKYFLTLKHHYKYCLTKSKYKLLKNEGKYMMLNIQK